MRPSRRTFLKVAGVAGAGLTLGIVWKVRGGGPPPPTTDAAFAPDAYLRIDTDGSITVMVARSEMGQGVATGLVQLVAEELDVGIGQVSFEFAEAHPVYANAMGMQLTGGSTSIVESWRPLREAGATARAMLLQAAALEWGASAADLSTEGARVLHRDGRSAGYGELASAAAALPVPDAVELKDPSEFAVIGTSVPRLDALAKATGTAVFGVDAGPDDALVAVVARCPVFGGRVRSFDASAALAVEGVREVLEIASGVAVVADGYWPALKGREALEVEWDEGDAATLSDADIDAVLARAIADGGDVAREDGDVEAVLSGGGEPIRATYTLPYLAHATMEPMNCTALVEEGRCTVWAPTQFQDGPAMYGGGSRQAAADAAGVDADGTRVVTTYLGGGFGRRGEMDFVREAAELAARVDGAVKVMWSREDDIRHDFYRPASRHEFAAVLGDDGMPLAWRHDMALQSLLAGRLPGWMPGFLRRLTVLRGGIDPVSVEGAANHPYRVPATRVTCATVELPIPVGFWRSVGHSHTAFVVESFVDELAHAAGREPYEYRRELLADHPRHVAVLDAVAAAADWGSPPPAGRARGIAVAESFGSYVAQVAEVSMDTGVPRVHRVWCAVDCGTVVNPGLVRDQMEGGILFGLTAALYGKVRIDGGRAVESNFTDYRMVRMDEAPEVHVQLVPNGDAPGGVGEPGTPPIAAAVTNALFALTGERIRNLPIRG